MSKASKTVFAALLLVSVCASVYAQTQTCDDDVPATAPDSRFVDNGDGTVTDVATGLMWMQCTEGLSGVDCASGTKITMTWSSALNRAAGAVVAGYSDWRLPNKNELESLVELRCGAPAINATFFPNTPAYSFWSSSTDPRWGRAWEVRFWDGVVYSSYMYFTKFVRLVRGGQ